MPEYDHVIQEAVVTALQTIARASTDPAWTDIAGTAVAAIVGLGQCGLIAWGIKVMKGSNEIRTATMKALQAQGEVLADIGAGIREVLERTDPTTRQRPTV